MVNISPSATRCVRFAIRVFSFHSVSINEQKTNKQITCVNSPFKHNHSKHENTQNLIILWKSRFNIT